MRADVRNDEQTDAEEYILEPMRLEDVSEVSSVERRCFTNPWPESAYRRELRHASSNHYIVLRRQLDDEQIEAEPEPRSRLGILPLRRRIQPVPRVPIVGFAGMWALYDEAHVTTIGVAPEQRGRNLGELLLVSLFDEALRRNAQWVTLEVRVSNDPAIALYEKYGFTRQGVRRRYYSDNGEDAHIMWSPSLHDDRYLARFEAMRAELSERLASASLRVIRKLP